MAAAGPVPDPTQLASDVEQHGVSYVLVLVCLGLVWLFMQERKENKELHGQILDTGKELTALAAGMQAAMNGFKETLDTLVTYLRKD